MLRDYFRQHGVEILRKIRIVRNNWRGRLEERNRLSGNAIDNQHRMSGRKLLHSFKRRDPLVERVAELQKLLHRFGVDLNFEVRQRQKGLDLGREYEALIAR